ncbi:MAG: LLM class flavin-dependent oxidoreductase [Actinoplanes sp.]
MGSLLGKQEPLDFHGEYYELGGAVLHPPLPGALLPRFFVSGSSPAAREAGAALDAVRLSYPDRPETYEAQGGALAGAGVRFGIIARESADEAWSLARRRFGAYPQGEGDHFRALLGRTDSTWFWNLSRRHQFSDRFEETTYWLYPFHSHRVFCPYLVGSHAEVAEVLARYAELGIGTLLVDTPAVEEDLHHIRVVLDRLPARVRDAGPDR